MSVAGAFSIQRSSPAGGRAAAIAGGAGGVVGGGEDGFAAGLDPGPVEDQVDQDHDQEQQGEDEVDVAPVVLAQAEQVLDLAGVAATAKAVAVPAA